MIRIFNNKLKKEILIDDKSDLARLHPNDWLEDNPHVQIDLKGIDFFKHAQRCPDCKTFYDDLGSSSIDWFIQYLNKTKRLNLKYESDIKGEYNLKRTMSNWFSGTKLKLKINNDTTDSLGIVLKAEEILENFERCSFLRDQIKGLSE